MAIISEAVKNQATREATLYQLLNDAGTDETTSDALESLTVESATLIVVSSADAGTGTVVLEGSPISNYSGTWVNLGSISVNAASRVFSVTAGKIDELPMPYLRARISDGMTGGTIDVYLAVRRA